MLRRELRRRETVEVTADHQRHDPHLRRGRSRGPELLGDRERGSEVGVGMLHESRRRDPRGVADPRDTEAAMSELVGDVVGKSRAVGAVEHPHVNCSRVRWSRWMRRLHARLATGADGRGVVPAQGLPAEPAANREGRDEQQQPPPATAMPVVPPGRRQVASSEHRHALRA